MNLNTEILLWLNQVVRERFGEDFFLKEVDVGLSLSIKNYDGEIIFDNLDLGFFSPGELKCCEFWYPESEGFERTLGENLPMPGSRCSSKTIVEKVDNGFQVHFDIFGLTYWSVNRLEELVSGPLDNHGRFPAVRSHAYKNQYLDRPIVDEWLLVLRQIILRQWPEVKLKKHVGRLDVSHDVDRPLRYYQGTFFKTIRDAIKDSIKNINPLLFLTALRIRKNAKDTLGEKDPYNTFDWLMDVSESLNIKSTFYFICGRTDPKLDASYNIEDISIRKLLNKVHSRGHKVGLHPSYKSFKSVDIIQSEFRSLNNILREEGIQNKGIPSRMHFLRWSHPITLTHLSNVGVVKDNTLGYAEISGFRCGSCFEYPGFDPILMKQLKIRIKPLIVMDVSITSEKYMAFGISASGSSYIRKLKDNCFYVGGDFSILWHNSELRDKKAKAFYKEILGSI